MNPKIQIALGLVVLVALLVAGIAVVVWLWTGLVALPGTILAPLVVASATVIVGVITVVGGRILERRASVERDQRPTKVLIYDQFMTFWYRVFELGGAEKPADQEILAYLAEFSRQMILWGSNDVVHRYAEFRRHTQENDLTVELPMPSGLTPTMAKFEAVLRAIRADLGNRNRGIKDGEIVRLVIEHVRSAESTSASAPGDGGG